MVKDQKFLKSKASYCLDIAKKMGATEASVTVGHSISETVNSVSYTHLTLPTIYSV